MKDDSLPHQEKQARVQAIWAGKGGGDQGARGGSNGGAGGVLPQRDTIDIANISCHATPAAGAPTANASATQPQAGVSGTMSNGSQMRSLERIGA